MSFVSITPYAGSLIGRSPAQTDGSDDIEVLIADDRCGASYSLWALLNWKEGIRLIATVDDGEQALRVARERKPCVCLVSATLLARDGLELADRLKRLSDPPRVLIYADSVDARLAGLAIIADADGVFSRYQTSEKTVAAIRRVASGDQSFLTPVRDGFDQLAATVDGRDRAIVAMLLDNAHPDDIAGTLGLSARSVRERRRAILKRLDLTATSARRPEPLGCSTHLSPSARPPAPNRDHAAATSGDARATTMSGDITGRLIPRGRRGGLTERGRPPGRPIAKRAVSR
jgi:DNA-binding NarL/FixJ family response regulator